MKWFQIHSIFSLWSSRGCSTKLQKLKDVKEYFNNLRFIPVHFRMEASEVKQSSFWWRNIKMFENSQPCSLRCFEPWNLTKFDDVREKGIWIKFGRRRPIRMLRRSARRRSNRLDYRPYKLQKNKDSEVVLKQFQIHSLKFQDGG